MPGYDRFLDLNVYNGTEAELRARFQSPVIESESKMIHLFIPNNLSDETMRAVTEHLDALAKDVTARGDVYPYGPPAQTQWYELWPTGILNPQQKLRAAIPCTLYSAQNGQPQRTITDGRVLDVYERQGEWFRVTTITAPIWVRASQVVVI